MTEPAEADHSVTTVLRARAPWLQWIRENFKPPSLAAIAGVAGTAAVWLWHQHGDLVRLDGAVKNLATAEQVAGLKDSLEPLRVELGDHDARIDRIERYLDAAHQVALEPPRRPRRRPPTP